MINIQRSKEIPASLQMQEIKDYLDLLADYQQDPANKTKPEPPVSYRSSDVLESFDRCFLKKCYLTEKRFANSWAMDVEHFIPKSEKPELRYEWSNLYPADPDANSMKPRKTPTGGYLDPCNKKDDVENDIIYTLVEYGKKPGFSPKTPTHLKAENTCQLLNHLHNGTDDNTEEKTETLRMHIKKKHDKVMETLTEWLGAKNKGNVQEETQAREELRRLLSRKTSFTMLMRSIPSVRKQVPPDLLD